MNNKPCYFRDRQILFLDGDYHYCEYFGVYLNKKLWLYGINSDTPTPELVFKEEDVDCDLEKYNLHSKAGDYSDEDLDKACKAFESELGIELELVAGLRKDNKGNFYYMTKKKPNLTNRHQRTYATPRVILHYKDGSHYTLKNCTTISVNPEVKYKYFIVLDFSKMWRYSFTEDEVQAITVIRKGRKKLIVGDEDYSLILETPKRW